MPNQSLRKGSILVNLPRSWCPFDHPLKRLDLIHLMSKINRNDSCPCGSGKKYKKCCLRKDEEARNFEKDLKSGFIPNASDEDWAQENAAEPEYEADMDEEYEADGEFAADPTDYASEIEDDSAEEPRHLSPKEKKVISDWWKQYRAMNDPDLLRAHVEKFLDEYPHLVAQLDLDDEPLFQLQGMYLKQKRYDEYPALLSRLRTEFPEAYRNGAGYFDTSLIIHLIINNRKEEVREYLEFFRLNPEEDPDKLFEVIDFLKCWNCLDILAEFIPQIYKIVYSSSAIFGGEAIMGTVVYLTMAPHLAKGLAAVDPQALAADMKNYDKYLNPEWTEATFLQKRLAIILGKHEQWSLAQCNTRQQAVRRYDEITANFMGWLATHKELDWLAAEFHRRCVFDYLADALPEKKKPLKPFPFEENNMERVLTKYSRRLIWYDPTRLYASLNGLYWFTEFLEATRSISQAEALQGRESCTRIFERSYPLLLEHDAKTLAWQRFPRL